jgi:unsaturated chondroitin disaccharide hydrolase
MKINTRLLPSSLHTALNGFFALSEKKILRLQREWKTEAGTPVFTVRGKYTTRGWTEWTQGFQYGCQILQFDATDDARFLELGRENTVRHMAPHVSHIGVHDHGFNNVSTYGNLRRLALEGRTDSSREALDFYELALKVSGAVQAARWTPIADGTGFIHSFNGPHSLFSDTIRSCRALMMADHLGHALMAEGDTKHSLLQRGMQHIDNTLRFNVYHGKKRDQYDIRGRVAHEGIFNTADGNYRCPSTQQGYSAFTTWTRGLAWILLGCAEELEYFATLPKAAWQPFDRDGKFLKNLLEAARATADFYIEHTALDGIPYWDTGAPCLAALGNYRKKASQPDNPHEPVDSSAAAIAAQGLLRLGKYLGDKKGGKNYYQAGLTTAKTLFNEPYLSTDPKHHGLLLHSVYHHPNGWDHVPKGKRVPFGESSMWGDYHAMELAVYLQREIKDAPYLSFFAPQQ